MMMSRNRSRLNAVFGSFALVMTITACGATADDADNGPTPDPSRQAMLKAAASEQAAVAEENQRKREEAEASASAASAAAAEALPFAIEEQPRAGEDGTIRVTVDTVPTADEARGILAALRDDFNAEGGYFVQINCSTGGTEVADNRIANGEFAVGAVGAARTGLTAGTGTIEVLDGRVCPATQPEPVPEAPSSEDDFTTALLAAYGGAAWAGYVTWAKLDGPDHAVVQTSITDPRGPDGSAEATRAIAVCEGVVSYLASQGIDAGVRVQEADETTFAIRGAPGSTLPTICAEY